MISGIISQGLFHFLPPMKGMDETEDWEWKGLHKVVKRNSLGIL